MTSKRFIQRALCGSGLAAALRHVGRQSSLIVTYHGVIPDQDGRGWQTADMVLESLFRQHLAFYRKNYHVVPLRQLVDSLRAPSKRLQPGALAITFDDGLKNNLTWAVPALQETGFSATFFLTTGFLDGTVDLWWVALKRCVLRAQQLGGSLKVAKIGEFSICSSQDAEQAYRTVMERLKQLKASDRTEILKALQACYPGARDVLQPVYEPLTWDEVRQMASEGMEIGAHTVTHSILSKESDERTRQEIFESVRRIRDELRVSEIPFSYPNGQREDFTDETEKLVRESGCYTAAACFPGRNRPGCNMYRLRRHAIAGYHSVNALDIDLCGLRSAMKQLVRLGKRMFRTA